MTRLCRCGHAKRVHQQYTWGGYLRCTGCLCPPVAVAFGGAASRHHGKRSEGESRVTVGWSAAVRGDGDPLDVVLPDQDTDALTAAFLFATPPSDRALWGWDGAPRLTANWWSSV